MAVIGAFIGGMVGAVAPALGTAAFGAYVAGAGFSTFLTTTFVGQMLTTVAFSALAQALQPKPEAPGIRTQGTLAGGVNPEFFQLGRYATDGVLIAPAMSHSRAGNNKNYYLNYVIELSSLPGADLHQMYVDNNLVEFGTEVHPDYGRELAGDYAGKAWVKIYDGSQTAADPMLVAKYPAPLVRPWSASMVGAGICYAVLTFAYDREVFRSFPKVRFIMNGVPLYDPRKDNTVGGSGSHRADDQATWELTENPAVMIYNIKRGIPLPGGGVWGGSVDAADLPLGNWFAAMNACDVLVDLDGFATSPAYRAGFEVRLADKPAAVIEELLKACSGQVSEIGGVWKIRVGGPGLPVHFFTDNDIIGDEPEKFDPFPPPDQVFNGIHAAYPSPEMGWETHDAPPLYNDEYAADDGEQRIADLALPAVPFNDQVQRLMDSYLTEERRFKQHELSLPSDALLLEPLDTVAWTSVRNGYVSKPFEVTRTVHPLLTSKARLALRERDSADFVWDSGKGIKSGPTYPISRVLAEAQDVTGSGAAGSSLQDGSGTARVPAIHLVWDGLLAETVQAIEWQVRYAGQTEVALSGVSANVGQGFDFITQGVLPATDYEVRMQAVMDGPTVWTAWVAVITDDTRPSLSDLGDDVGQQISTAHSAAQQGIQNAQQASEQAATVQQNLDTAVEGLQVNYGAAQQAAADAQTAKNLAETAAISAATSEGVSVSTARDQLPSDFREEERFYSSELIGHPDNLSDPNSYITFADAAEGPVAQIDLAGAGNKILTKKGVAALEVGRTYEIRALVRQIGGASPAQALLQFRNMHDDYSYYSNSTKVTNLDAIGVVQEVVHRYTPVSPSAAYARPLVFSGSQVSGAILQVLSFHGPVDVSDRQAAQSAASAAASSAASAAVSETQSGQHAAAAASERQAAETARAEAEAAEGRAVTARQGAEDAEASSSSWATQSANSETASGNHAAAAAGSASVATTKANEAGTSEASAAASAQIAAQIGPRGASVISDPLFAEVGQNNNCWRTWVLAPTTMANEIYPAGQTLEYDLADGENGGVSVWQSIGWEGQQNAEAYAVEVEFTLHSGTLAGAGFMVDWNASTDNRQAMSLTGMLREPLELGKVMTARGIFKRGAVAGTFQHHDLYLMAGYSGFGAIAAKRIQFHSARIRVATPEEMGAGEVGAQISAAVASEAAVRVSEIAALASTQNTQQSEINGLLSTTSSQAITLAGIDGTVQAMQGIAATTVDVNGVERIAGLRLTSAADPSGAGSSVVQLIGDDVIGDGTLSFPKFQTGLTVNQLENTRFIMGKEGWASYGSGGSQAETTLLLRPPGTSWAGTNYQTLYLVQAGSSPDGYVDLRNERILPDGTQTSMLFPVEPGKWYGVAAQFSMHRCEGTCYLFWRDKDGVFLGAAAATAIPTAASSGNNPEEWPLRWTHGQAPANAAYAQFSPRKYGTLTGTSSYMFIHKPYSFESHAAAQAPPPYQPEGVGMMHGGLLMADTLDIRNAIINGSMQSDNYVPGVSGAYINLVTGAAELHSLTVRESMIAPDAVTEILGFQQGIDYLPPKGPYGVPVQTVSITGGAGSLSMGGIVAGGGGGFASRGILVPWVCGEAPSNGDLYARFNLGSGTVLDGYAKVRSGPFIQTFSVITDLGAPVPSYEMIFDFENMSADVPILGVGYKFIPFKK